MKAVVYTRYGSSDVLPLKGVEKSTPKTNEELVKIHVTTITLRDTIMRSPKILGPDVIPPKSILPNNTLVSIPPFQIAGILPLH